MLTQGDSRIDERPIALDPMFTLDPPWWDNYPAIRQKVMQVGEAFRTTIALLGADTAAELPEPMLLLSLLPGGQQFADFRGLAAEAFKATGQQLVEAKTIWDVAEREVRSALENLDKFRRHKLAELHEAYSQWRQTLAARPAFVPADPLALAIRLEGELQRLESWQHWFRAVVVKTAKTIEDWIDTVRSVWPDGLPSADKRQQDRRDLLAELRRTLPASIAGNRVAHTIDDGIEAALAAGDVVVMGESSTTGTRRYLTSQMETLERNNVGAILVQVPHDLQDTLDRFAPEGHNRDQLLSDLQSAGIGGGDALADLVATAADHGVKVVAFDTRWGQGSEPTQLQIKNHYMAARLTQTLAELPEGKKNVVAVVADEYTDSLDGVDALTGGVSFDEQPAGPSLPAGTVAFRRGEIALGAMTIPRESGGDDSTFVFAPPPR